MAGLKTQVGTFVKAERLPRTQITKPDRPEEREKYKTDFARNEAVTAPESAVLLILHFDVHPTRCARLNRLRLHVKDEKGNRYEYGAWRVFGPDYEYCGAAGDSMLVIGPWGNTFWDPVEIKPKFGTVYLIYPVPAEATGLVFTDGLVTIDLEPYLKRERKQEAPERP